MGNKEKKDFLELVLKEASSYLANVKKLEALEEEYKTTYNARAKLGEEIVALSKEILSEQKSYNYYLRGMTSKYERQEMVLIPSLTPLLEMLKEVVSEEYGIKNYYYKEGEAIKKVMILSDINILNSLEQDFYSKEEIIKIINTLRNEAKTIVMVASYDAQLVEGFKQDLNIMEREARMLYSIISSDELGEAFLNFQNYIERNNRRFQDIPKYIIKENIKPKKLKKERKK